ncbi:MAG TPA: AAA family ATPase [Alphaproteobacteria bacterium]|nr:AAA family ATPase [Alphaproteobacteria bacterium]
MGIAALAVEGYRSLRRVRLELGRLTVIAGANGTGKSNLYRALMLLQAAARGELARSLAEEGGMPSVLWAGPRAKGSVRMALGVEGEDWGYDLACGLPIPYPSMAFTMDPEVKSERVTALVGRRRVALMERDGQSARLRNAEGRWAPFDLALLRSEAALSQLREPQLYPELSALSAEMAGWRFYHQFRSDADSALRQPQVAITNPVLSSDGRDLAATLATIRFIGDADALDAAIDGAFPGARLLIQEHRGRLELLLETPGLFRPLEARELSDGTLRYLCLVAALLSPRPPRFLALNEPETSLHPDLLAPLAALIVDAARDSQLWVVTHSDALAAAIAERSGVRPLRLEKVEGATRIVEADEGEADA